MNAPSSPSQARSARHSDSVFTVENWVEQPYSDVAGELKLTHTSVGKTFHGDVEGQGVLQYLMFYGPNDQTRVLGLERITCVLAGRSGSFVLEHHGADDGFEARETLTILADSGTGGLTGIRGTGESVANREGKFIMSLDYELE